MPPTFQRLRQSAPLHVTWLSSLKVFEDAKQLAKYMFPAISQDLSFKISRGEHASRSPLADLHLGTGSFSLCKEFYRFIECYIPRQCLNLTLRNSTKVPLNLCAPLHFCHAFYALFVVQTSVALCALQLLSSST